MIIPVDWGINIETKTESRDTSVGLLGTELLTLALPEQERHAQIK